MVDFVGAELARLMLETAGAGLPATLDIQLHTGNPGAEGNNNKAAEGKKQVVTLRTTEETGNPRLRDNKTAAEWVEVSTEETYTWISLYQGGGGVFLLLNIELTEPVAVKVGDTFRIPIGKLTIEVPAE